MDWVRKTVQLYFNYAYNPVYDFAIARMFGYRQWQQKCLGKLYFRDEDKVLCIGLGTGNELRHIVRLNNRVNITGVDCSDTALRKARRKASQSGITITLLRMDASQLDFSDDSFDHVVCLHVMDFLDDHMHVAKEMLRVLKPGGHFVITFPCSKEGAAMGMALVRENMRSNIEAGRNRLSVYLETAVQILACLVYIPLLMRPKGKTYSANELAVFMSRLTGACLEIEEYPAYRDLIVYGQKRKEE